MPQINFVAYSAPAELASVVVAPLIFSLGFLNIVALNPNMDPALKLSPGNKFCNFVDVTFCLDTGSVVRVVVVLPDFEKGILKVAVSDL